MLARVQSVALSGLESVPVLVEVSITNGLPANAKPEVRTLP